MGSYACRPWRWKRRHHPNPNFHPSLGRTLGQFAGRRVQRHSKHLPEVWYTPCKYLCTPNLNGGAYA